LKHILAQTGSQQASATASSKSPSVAIGAEMRTIWQSVLSRHLCITVFSMFLGNGQIAAVDDLHENMICKSKPED
jgi:hypothetical protein